MQTTEHFTDATEPSGSEKRPAAGERAKPTKPPRDKNTAKRPRSKRSLRELDLEAFYYHRLEYSMREIAKKQRVHLSTAFHRVKRGEAIDQHEAGLTLEQLREFHREKMRWLEREFWGQAMEGNLQALWGVMRLFSESRRLTELQPPVPKSVPPRDDRCSPMLDHSNGYVPPSDQLGIGTDEYLQRVASSRQQTSEPASPSPSITPTSQTDPTARDTGANTGNRQQIEPVGASPIGAVPVGSEPISGDNKDQTSVADAKVLPVPSPAAPCPSPADIAAIQAWRKVRAEDWNRDMQSWLDDKEQARKGWIRLNNQMVRDADAARMQRITEFYAQERLRAEAHRREAKRQTAERAAARRAAVCAAHPQTLDQLAAQRALRANAGANSGANACANAEGTLSSEKTGAEAPGGPLVAPAGTPPSIASAAAAPPG